MSPPKATYSAVNSAAGSKRRRPPWRAGLTLVTEERDFRLFYLGYSTSLTGTAMSRIALTFAVLASGLGAAGLGYVFAASVFPQVLVMLGGGVLADRVGRRRVMLCTDAARFVVQGVLTSALFIGCPPVWLFVALSAVLALGEGLFNPALAGLRADIVPADRLPDANALLGVVQSGATIVGPALAGLLVAITSPAVVIGLDALSYGLSVLALALLRIPPASQPWQSPWRDLADSWTEFRAQTWLGVTTVQFALFNLFTWAPYLLLGPILARQYLGGAGAWGVITGAFAGGSVVAGLAMVGRRPSRPLLVGTIGTFGYAVPCLLLALHAPATAVAAGAFVAGVGSAVNGALAASVQQQRVPRQMLARISAIQLTGSYALGSASWAFIGPLSDAVGAVPLLAFAAAWGVVSSAIVLALPPIRSVTHLAD